MGDSDETMLNTLHPLEVRLLRSVGADETITASLLIQRLGYNQGQCNQALSWLELKSFVRERERRTLTSYELTELGQQYLEDGTPEERILELLGERNALRIPEISERLGLANKDVGSAYGALAKAGAVAMDEQKRLTRASDVIPENVAAVRSLLARAGAGGSLPAAELNESELETMAAISKKRGSSDSPFRIVERDEVSYVLTEAGSRAQVELEKAGITGEELGELTPAMLKDGSWRGARFRAYNVDMPPSRVAIGRRNPYAAYLDEVKDKLTALGFEQFDGSLIETEFWNSDALFMPQFHSARDIHDVYQLAAPTHAKRIDEPYLSNVAAAHENGWQTGSRGWRYGFDREFTRRLILRSQGTAVSARALPSAKIPGRYFGMLRCFRPDDVDATHLSDFYQTEGIVLSEDVNLKTLLGLLKMFAEEVAGATDVKYVPGYFPFTEPSVEVHIKHPVLGWFELGGSGIFRPEVTEPLGVTVPVLAWGLGIDRMALMRLGLSDLRELFSPDIEKVRMRRSS